MLINLCSVLCSVDYNHHETTRLHIKFTTYFRINPGQEKSHAENSKWGTVSNSTQAHWHLHKKHKALVTNCALFQVSLTATAKSPHLQNSTKLLNNKHQPNTHGPHQQHHCLQQNVSLLRRWLMGEPSFVEIFQNNSSHWVEASWHGAMIKQQVACAYQLQRMTDIKVPLSVIKYSP